MTNYEFITTLDSHVLDALCRRNFLKFSVKRDIEIYRHYSKQCEVKSKMLARFNTAEKFCTSEETVSRIIQKMKQ